MSKVVCAGGLFIARNTGRFLFLCRTHEKTCGNWGLVGGKSEPTDTSTLDTLLREIHEEVGTTPPIEKVIPLELYTSDDSLFHYNTYAFIVNNEFIPTLNSEHSGYAWCSINAWPRPLHTGVRTTLQSNIVCSKLEVVLAMI